jgi:cyclase
MCSGSSAPGTSPADGPEDREPFEELADGVLVWWGDLGVHEQTNVGVVRSAGATVVIDSNFPWAAERLVRTITANGWVPVTHVVNTHYHVDHSMGNGVFAAAGATIVGAAGQGAELRAKGQEDAVVQTGSESDLLMPPALEFSGELRFFSPDLILRSVEPAHTSSDVVAWLPEARVLFVGDLAVNWEHGNNLSDADADIPGWLRVLEQCIALDPAVVVPAHGARMTTDDLRAQRDFIAELWDHVRSGRPDRPDEFVRKHPRFVADEEQYAEMADSLRAAARNGG